MSKANILKAGEKAPDFSAIDQNEKKITLSEFSGQTVVIYFYPKDNTPGCTVQACNLRDHYSELTKRGIQVIGVSADSASKHQKFIAKFSLPFPLIADESHEVLNKYGVWGEKKFMGKVYDGIHRTTFIINEKGIIDAVILKPKTKYHSEEILEILDNASKS